MRTGTYLLLGMVEREVFIVDVRGRVQTKLDRESRWSLGQRKSGEERKT